MNLSAWPAREQRYEHLIIIIIIISVFFITCLFLPCSETSVEDFSRTSVGIIVSYFMCYFLQSTCQVQ